MNHRLNLESITLVYRALRELQDLVVFVGGATVSLYADKPEQAEIRPTTDIDLLIEIGTYGEYVKLQELLYELGFKIDATSTVTCRYTYYGLAVDIMPTDEKVLGFSNRWYKDGFENIIKFNVDSGITVNIFSPVYFIASKLEAFKGRGENDGRTSTDFEDIVFVLDNRSAIWDEMISANTDVIAYLKDEWNVLLGNRYFEDWLSGHLEYETATIRAKKIIAAMQDFILR